jgi:hypothetical protein
MFQEEGSESDSLNDETSSSTCQNLQNKLLNITVLFIWYWLASLKKNVTRQTWQALFHFGEYLFQSTRHQ